MNTSKIKENFINNLKNINHKDIWLNSISGMTMGFIATLIVGTIIGIPGLYSSHNIFISVKEAMTFITPFGIGVGIGVRHKLKPLHMLSIGISSLIVAKSMLVPSYEYLTDSFNFTNVQVNISLEMEPGDVFAAWISGIVMLYFFDIYKVDSPIDLFLLPLIGIIIGITNSFFITYFTTMITISLEYVIEHSINETLWSGIILAPVFGLIIGLALSFPTSSAAMVFALHLHGDSAVIAIAATTAQMISFGLLTYISTKSIPKALAVGFGTSMLQIRNFIKKPIILIIPSIASMLGAMVALGAFHGLLEFSAPSPTSGMGSCALYGQIFTLNENGWGNMYAWLNVLMQLFLPILITLPLAILFVHQKKWITKKDMLF